MWKNVNKYWSINHTVRFPTHKQTMMLENMNLTPHTWRQYRFSIIVLPAFHLGSWQPHKKVHNITLITLWKVENEKLCMGTSKLSRSIASNWSVFCYWSLKNNYTIAGSTINITAHTVLYNTLVNTDFINHRAPKIGVW